MAILGDWRVASQEGHMQLSFYPNGSREAEPGHCSVALSRGPDCPGIKFEFSVNGRSTGPKVCLGRRYLGDYIKPFEDDGNTSQVVVSINVLELIPGRGESWGTTQDPAAGFFILVAKKMPNSTAFCQLENAVRTRCCARQDPQSDISWVTAFTVKCRSCAVGLP
eukprot:s3589_g3.t1